jgi:hypothetical protein
LPFATRTKPSNASLHAIRGLRIDTLKGDASRRFDKPSKAACIVVIEMHPFLDTEAKLLFFLSQFAF